ncbi:MAG: hypothetical protein GSR80_000318 [Desulfurococcales archaeon]|nr:hypothetical protein [Desulfurococcales archaeon]
MGAAPARACPRPRGPRGHGVALILPCNGCVRLGDYMLCDGWRRVWRYVWDLVLAGAVDLAAVDSCKPGLVYWGQEASLSWCDLSPRWDYYRRRPWRLEALERALEANLLEFSTRHRAIVYYVDVKAYRLALEAASRPLRARGYPIVDAGPHPATALGFRSRANLARLRSVLAGLASTAPPTL